MKKLFFTVGVVFLLIGVVLSLNYNSEKLMRKIEIAANAEDAWEVSGYLQAGDKIRIICHPGKNWEKPVFEEPDDYTPVSHRHIWFEIVDANGKITEYNTAWTIYESGGGQIPFSRCFVNWTVRDGIEVEQQYPTYVGGTVKLNGIYTARIARDEYGKPFFEPSPIEEPEAPTYFAIEKEYPVVVYPYTYFLPIGISFSTMGIVLSTWAARSRKRRKRSFSK